MENEQFYAACLLPETRLSFDPFDAHQFVSKDKNYIIDLIKKHKGSRFKCFTDYDAALRFVEDVCDVETSNSNNSVEAPLPYPSLDIKNLNVFKRAIESKDLQSVRTLIEDNPRYLITYNFDGPTILMQGPRYNAAHIAVRSNSCDILAFLLEKISSLDFIQKVYLNFSKNNIIEKRDHILDLYLNTPDKVNCDTPLHFACKIGCITCVSTLTNYMPICDTKKRNRLQKLPQDVIIKKELKEKIEELLCSNMFVTVVESREDLTKTVQEPCMGRMSLVENLNDDKNSLQISSITGPMTPEKASAFFETLRSPQKCSEEQRKLRLQDPQRGLEQVACRLSYDYEVPFSSYWPFLEDFADFASTGGLNKLDRHLRKSHDSETLSEIISQKLSLQEALEKFQQEEDDSSCNVSSKSSPNSFRVNSGGDFSDESSDDEYYTAPSSPVSNSDLPSVQQFYINGSEQSKDDTDVLNCLELALSKHLISLEQLRSGYPYVYHWVKRVRKNLSSSTQVSK